MHRQISNRFQLVQQRLGAWLEQYHSAAMANQAQALPLRRDMVTLLTFVRDHKVIGAQGTGNMPLKAVREVTARFVQPPQLDATIGKHIYRLRSEADLWPLYFLHILAEVGRLLEIAPARRWRLTAQGEKFLDTFPVLQVPSLLVIWWYEVNWLVAYPFAGMGDRLPPALNRITLARLRSLPLATPVSFDEFADGLIEKAGLTWTAQDSRFAQMLLRGSIERMVMHILADFGAISRTYREKPLGRGTISELASFELTPFGQALLDAIVIVGGGTG